MHAATSTSGGDHEGDTAGEGQATSRGDCAGPGPSPLGATLAEYRRLRAASSAPHPAWILGSPLIQAHACSYSASAHCVLHVERQKGVGHVSMRAMHCERLSKSSKLQGKFVQEKKWKCSRRCSDHLQASVFGTSVFAARAMAASDWPGFADGGALWFPDLTKAAVVIHWGQVTHYAHLCPEPEGPHHAEIMRYAILLNQLTGRVSLVLCCA